MKRQDGNEYEAQLTTLNAKKKTCLQSSGEENYQLRMEKAYLKSRRMTVILL
jgi:hypothetical protein